jgi:hypothetical protein
MTCGIHLGRLERPVSLNCGHNFCKSCIEPWARFKELRCKTCGQTTILPNGKDSL